MTTAPVHSSRIIRLKTGIEAKSPTHVLYWMSTALRTTENPSLEHASHLSNRYKIPLRVAHLLHPTAADGEPLPERHALFQLQSARDVAAALRKQRVPFSVHHVTTNAVQLLTELAEGASAVVADADYMRPGRALRQELASALAIPFYVVEANLVVPIAQASEKAEHAARTIRPKITRALPQYLVETPHIELKHQPKALPSQDKLQSQKECVLIETDKDIERVLADWEDLDRGAPPVKQFKGGETSALQVYNEFLKERLASYSTGRNEPALQLQSDLSPYLRAGNISPITIALGAKEMGGGKPGLKDSLASFLEELIVRRELAANACWYREQYDDFKAIVPNFAQISLELHKSDKREHNYSYEELEAGVTHDPYWNAAQLEMVVRGKMHGYMRMYWAKQVIGWVADPEDAFAYALRLNNRWELDAVDPNSVVGVAWCFGLHDQGWRERSIWGKVRYMNDAGLKRKFNMAAYVAMVDSLVQKEGLPQHISELRKERKMDVRQTTIEQVVRRRKAVSKAGTKRASQKASTPAAKRGKQK